MMYVARFFFFCVIAVLPQLTMAEEPLTAWKVMPEKSSLMFTAYQNNVPVEGSFQKFEAVVFFDANQLEKSSIYTSIDLSSVQTGYDEVAASLKREQWFDVEHFPTAIFKTHLITSLGDNKYEAKGTFTLHGVKKNLTLPFTLEIKKDKDETIAVAEGKTTLKRTDFGVGQGEWANTEMVADKVEISIRVVASQP